MDNSKRRKSLSVLYSLAILATLTLFLLPITRWIAASHIAANFAPLGNPTNGWLRHTMGVKEDRQMNGKAINDRILEVAASEPSDYGLQYAAILMTPQMTDSFGGTSTVDYQLHQIFNLRYKKLILPRTHADFLRQASRNMSVGRIARQELASDYTTGVKTTSSYRPAVERADLLSQMMESVCAGMRQEPDNAFFPLMKSAVFFALEDEQSALSALHAAAQCTLYEDYATEEAADLNRMAAKAFGKQSVISDITQGASVLFPHYAQLRGAVRLAVVSAVELEAKNDKLAGLAIREDILKVGHLMRSQSKLMIGSLVGSALQQTARVRLGGVPQRIRVQESTSPAPTVRTAESLSRMTAYLNDMGRRDLAHFVGQEDAAAKHLKKFCSEKSALSIFDGEKIVRLGVYHTFGNILLVNVFWLALFGGVATFLLKRKTKSPRPALALLACWFGIALFYSWYNAPNQTAYSSAMSILCNLSSEGNEFSDNFANMRAFSLLSVAMPFSVVLLACAVSLFSRVPLSLGILRGLRGLCVPIVAVLLLLWVPLTAVTAAKEQAATSEYSDSLHNEREYLSRLR